MDLDFGRYAVRTFAIELEAPAETAVPSRYESIGLPYNKKITSCNHNPGCGEFAHGIACPKELWEEKIVSSGVPFTMAPATEPNAVVCKGQTIDIPEGAANSCSTAGDTRYASKISITTSEPGISW